ncbi:MAG: potassium channel protein [Planctomycetes bacterium]|nr:potassium channel protein [Planctomycetota bacterium]
MVRPEDGILRRLTKPVLIFALVVLIGAWGYNYLESIPLLDALYMAVITVTTVGFREVQELDEAGRVFTIFLILFGVGAATYFATSVANYLIAGEIKGFLEQRKMQDKIKQLSGHFIVCGYGRMGEQVARELRREHKPLVVIERSEETVQEAIAAGHLALQGDAENDHVLRATGVERAYGLVAVLDTDAANLMVTLSARTLNENLYIIARTNNEENDAKLIAAGAHRVLFPHGLGGRRMAQMAIRPTVAEFLEVVMHDEELELWLEEMTVAIESKLDGCAVYALDIRRSTGANIVAVRQRTGKLLAAPTPDTKLQAGDIIVALGTREQLNALSQMTH